MMGSVLLDVTTRGLNEARQNVSEAGNMITQGTKLRMQEWYNKSFKKSALRIIETGEGMAPNKEPYATWKRNNYGIDHPLGKLSGMLYAAIESSEPTLKETRGKEVRLWIRFSEPHYIAYVIDGGGGRLSRNFVELARDRTLQKLFESIGNMFDGLDFTEPHSKLISTILSYREKELTKVW